MLKYLVIVSKEEPVNVLRQTKKIPANNTFMDYALFADSFWLHLDCNSFATLYNNLIDLNIKTK
jgi:hypothetical protein